MLFSQALSDKYNSVLGYLGGSFITLPNNSSNNANIINTSNSSSSNNSSFTKKEDINICHITHYTTSERYFRTFFFYKNVTEKINVNLIIYIIYEPYIYCYYIYFCFYNYLFIFIPNLRKIGDLINNNINEVENSFIEAVQYFESKKVSCVGWYKRYVQ